MSRQASHTVFVGNIPYDVTEQELVEIFQEVGPIKSMRMVADKDTGKPKGYAFCEYFDRGTAEAAVRNLNQHEVSGRNLRVDYAEDHTPGGRGDRGDFRDGPGRGGGGRFDRERDGPRGPYGPPAGLRPLGAGSAASAAQAMATMLNSPQMTSGAAQETLNNSLGSMNPVQLFEVMSQMKTLVQQNPSAARQVLVSQPQLTRALFQAQILLGMVKPHAQPPAPARPPMQQQQGPPGPGAQPQLGPPVQQGPGPVNQQPGGVFPGVQPAQQGFMPHQQPQAAVLPAATAGQPQVVVLGPGGAQVILDPAAAASVQLLQQQQQQPMAQTIQPAPVQQLPIQPQVAMMAPQPVLPMVQPQQQVQPQIQPQMQQQVQQQAPQAAGAPSLSQSQQQAVLQQLLRLTPEQLEALPPVEKAQARAILNMLKQQQGQQMQG